MATVTTLTLADVRDPDGDYGFPHHTLTGETALILFAAEWHGRQDAVHIADAGLRGTCVDIQPDRLRVMEGVYPAGWEFVCADVFSFTETTPRTWDVVSLDCPTNLFQVCADLLPRWCALARDAVILGTGWDTKVVAPDGWAVTDVCQRSQFAGGVYWTVLQRYTEASERMR